MEFLKKHYEKFILSVVLLGLAAAAAILPMKVSDAQAKVDEVMETIIPPKIKPRPELDLGTNRQMLVRVQRGAKLDLSLPHLVFNPVKWERKPNGDKFKIQSPDDIGPRAVTIASIDPLYLVVSFESVTGVDDSTRYQVSVLRETDRSPRPRGYLARPGDRNDAFMLREVRGPRDNPTELVLNLAEIKKDITISKENPFRQVIGFKAELRYEPRNRIWRDVKRDSKIQVDRDSYKIIEINEKEVVMSNDSTQERIVLEYAAAQK